jgi:homoserine kinase
MANRKPKQSKSFAISLPATSANLGPAFDAAALAFDLHLELHASAAVEFSISARGRDPEICGKLEKHLILDTYRDVLEGEGKAAQALVLSIDNQIPIGKGCGSSAAARLAGIALAVHFGGLTWSESRIVGEASRLEHHPDNASACWMGGLTVAKMTGEREALVARIKPKGNWPLLLAIPNHPLSTEEARKVLPERYSRADAVTNIQNSMLLLAAFVQGRGDMLASVLGDRIHQPYRASLCPLLPSIEKLAGRAGILGVALSGAGPSVLIFLDPRAPASHAKTEVAEHLKKHKLTAELILTSITDEGGNANH